MSRPYVNFRKIAPCLFSIIVDYMGFGLVYPVVTAMFTEGGSSVFPQIVSATSRNFYLGLAYLLYPLFMFFGASMLGDLSDMYGRKKVLLLSMVGILISFLLMSWGIFSHSLVFFLVGRGFSGLMAGSQPLCMAAIADLSTPESKAWNLSLVTLTNCVGLVFGPFIGGIFTEQFFLNIAGYSFPFIIAAIFALIGFFLIFFLFEETFHAHKEKQLKITRPITIFIEAFHDKKIRLLTIVVFLQLLALMLYYQTSGIFLSDLFHYTSAKLGYFYGFMGAFFAVGVMFVIPYALRRWKIEWIATYGFIIMGIFALFSVFYKNEIYLWLDVIPVAIAHSVGYTALATLFSNSASDKHQGWIMGVCAAAIAVSFVVAGFSTNLLPYLGPVGLLVIAGVIGIISGLLMLRYTEKWGAHKQNPNY